VKQSNPGWNDFASWRLCATQNKKKAAEDFPGGFSLIISTA
jgi:hypothetical protein